jgi:EAL domain-containing protein (putative c-di-GMP-specific phosphodiesterase class I)
MPLKLTPLAKHARVDSERALEAAIKPGELEVAFQPIVNLKTKSRFAVEALARCQVPQFRNPTALFEHAVNNHYCGRLGRMIRQITFQRCGGMPVFVNIHPVELNERWLIRPDDPIFSHDHEVYLEITESVPFSHYDLCVSVLREIRRRGQVHLVIDDLGAGYSNLGRISDLFPDIVKLDMELVAEIDKNSRQQKLIASIVQLCVNLGAQVVAEGIETTAQLEAVIDAGVHFGQGHLFGKPRFSIDEIKWPLNDGPYSSAGKK